MRTRMRSTRGHSLLEIPLSMLLLSTATVVFASLYPTASKASRMTGSHSQAVSAVQHKVDELRAVGYGRLNYIDLRAAGIVDATATTSPYHFEVTNDLQRQFPDPVGTVSVSSAGTNLALVTVRLHWAGAPGKVMEGNHEVSVLIANE